MILRKYGTSMQSVELNFDSRALTEIGFRRDHAHSISVEDFETGYERVGLHELLAEEEGWVQDETEQRLLDQLEAGIQELIDWSRGVAAEDRFEAATAELRARGLV